MFTATTLALVATAAGLIRAWPQAWRILRLRESRGVSAQTWTLILVANLTWGLLGVVKDIPVTVAYNVLSSVGVLAVLVMVTWQRRDAAKRIVATLVTAAVVLAATVHLWPGTGIDVLAIGISLVMFLPQLWAVLRGPATGVSRSSWALATLSVACWGWYGLLAGHGAFVVSAAVMVPASLAILWRAHIAACAPDERWAPASAGSST